MQYSNLRNNHVKIYCGKINTLLKIICQIVNFLLSTADF